MAKKVGRPWQDLTGRKFGHWTVLRVANNVDNDGDYCKANCIWASRTVQTRNRRR